jgi:hypothetical protein
MQWPTALVAELAARRCVVFLGAGASASCVSADGRTSPPGWKAFLDALRSVADPDGRNSAIDNYLSKERYLDAAEIIHNKLSPADFARLVRETFVAPRYKPSPIHEAVLKIDPKVVITTNYDDIYDTYCRNGMAASGYNVCRYHDTHLVPDLRSPVRLVVKAHGCVSDPSLIVLTRSQYFRARQQHACFFNVLDAIFVTHTILFVGYGLADPDIELVLENANIAAPSAHPHYALMPDNIAPDIEAAMRRSHNVQFIKYTAGDPDQAAAAMNDLRDAVIEFRVSNPAG